MSTPPDYPVDDPSTLVERMTVRLRLVGTAFVAGVAVAVAALAGSALAGATAAGVDTAFVLGSLAFGFGLLGWSGAVALGKGIESMQTHLDTQTGWTEPDARRAMSRIIGFGFGVMAGATIVGSVVFGTGF